MSGNERLKLQKRAGGIEFGMISVHLALIENNNYEERLFEKLYSKYRFVMYSVAFSILQDESDAEDAVHDTFLSIAARQMPLLSRIEDEEDRQSYILKATRNTALNMLRRGGRRLPSDDIYECEQIDASDNPDEEFINSICMKHDYKQVVKAIRRLDKKYSDVLYYHFVLGLTAMEVAKIQNKNINTIKKQLVRGKKRLLEELWSLNNGYDR